MKEQHMRSSPYLLAAIVACGLTALSAPRANAMNSVSPAGLRAGLEAVDLTQPVHCRSYNHKVVGGHRWGKGCKPGVVVIREGSRSGPSINIESGTNRSGNRSGSGSGRGSSSNSTTNNSTTNTGTGAGATTSTTTGGATYTGAGAGATSTSTEATTTTGGATTTTGGTGAGATSSTTGGTRGGTAKK
jgi:hypothetical protein